MDCNATHSPNDDFTLCSGMLVFTQCKNCTSITACTCSMLTANVPDVLVTVDVTVPEDSYEFDAASNTYSVGMGKQFSLVCETSDVYTATWINSDTGQGMCKQNYSGS